MSTLSFPNLLLRRLAPASSSFSYLAWLHINNFLKVGLDVNSLDLLSDVGVVAADDGDEERVVVLQQVPVEAVLGRLGPGLAQQREKYWEEGQHAPCPDDHTVSSQLWPGFNCELTELY